MQTSELASNRLLISPRELAGMLGISVATVHRYAKTDQLPPAVMFGDRTMFRLTDVNEWLAALRQPDESVLKWTQKAVYARKQKSAVGGGAHVAANG